MFLAPIARAPGGREGHRLPYEPLPALGRGALHPFRGRVIRHRNLRARAGCLVPRLGVTEAEQAGEAAGDLPAGRVNGAQFAAGQWTFCLVTRCTCDNRTWRLFMVRRRSTVRFRKGAPS